MRRTPTTSSRDPTDTDTGTDGGDGSTTSPESSSPSLMDSKRRWTAARTDARGGQHDHHGGDDGAPVNTAAPVTLPPRTTPPPTQPPAPLSRAGRGAWPGADHADGVHGRRQPGRHRRGNGLSGATGRACGWIRRMRNVSGCRCASGADISDPKSARHRALCGLTAPALALGPEPTADGGWMIKVNYTIARRGHLRQDTSGETSCVINGDQGFLDTLVAAPGGIPENLQPCADQCDSGNYC
jgi:hypothetical protein